MSVDYVQDRVPENSGNRRHVYLNYLSGCLWSRFLNLFILVAAVIGIFSTMPAAVYAANPVLEGNLPQYGNGGQTAIAAVKKTAAGKEITLDTLKSYIGRRRSEIPYDLDPQKHGNYTDTVRKDIRMYGYEGKLSFVFKENIACEVCWESREIQRDDVNEIARDYREEIGQYEVYYEAGNHCIIISDAPKYYDCYISLPEHDPPLNVTIGMELATDKEVMNYGSDLLPTENEVNVRAEPRHDSALVFTYNPAPHQKSSGLVFKGHTANGYGSDNILHEWYFVGAASDSEHDGWVRSDLVRRPTSYNGPWHIYFDGNYSSRRICVLLDPQRGLNVRSNPKHGSDLVDTVYGGTKLYYYGETGKGYGSDGVQHEWYRVEWEVSGTAEEKAGWVRSDLVTVQYE